MRTMALAAANRDEPVHIQPGTVLEQYLRTIDLCNDSQLIQDERGLWSITGGPTEGALKVLAMDQAMRIPFKVSTTTSNFMIGVTAAASAGVYLSGGYIDPALALPVVLGVLAGSMLGARLLATVKTAMLRRVFSIVILLLALQMIWKGVSERLF